MRRQAASEWLVAMQPLGAHHFKYTIPLNLLNNTQLSDGETSSERLSSFIKGTQQAGGMVKS